MNKLLLLLPVFVATALAQTSYIGGNVTVEGTINYCGSDSGSGNTYVCLNPAGATRVQAYRTGHSYWFLATHTNSGAATLSIDGLSAVTMKKWSSSSLVDLGSGDVQTSNPFEVVYNGTYFILRGPSTGTAGGGGGTTRTWSYAVQGICQSGTPAAALWIPVANAPSFGAGAGAICDATHQQAEWQVATGATTTNWGLQFRVPAGATGAYALTLTWRTADTTTSHSLAFTPSYACIASGANPDNPSYTSLTTFAINPSGTANANVDAAYSFTPSCSAGSQIRLLLTASTNTITSPVNISYESVSLTGSL